MLETKVNTKITEAMKSKDSIALESLRALKSALLVEKTSKKNAGKKLTAEAELKIVQRLIKQRKDSAAIYTEQNRPELADPEMDQIGVLSQFLPEQISGEDLKKVITDIISQVGATSMKDMGKIMGIAGKALSGKADGKSISYIVKQQLSL